MGDARRRLSALIRTFQPQCTYCGGDAASTEMDHCPPIGVFDGRQRPKGLEFGSCHDCHSGTREMDGVVALMSRIYPEAVNPVQKAEVRKHIQAFIKNFPNIASIIGSIGPAVQVDGKTAHVFEIPEPARSELHEIMLSFAARFSLAMYREFVGAVAPKNSEVVTQWYSNYDLFRGEYPEHLVKAMGGVRTLEQGRHSVGSQFRYWGAIPIDSSEYFGTFAAFRESFAILGIIRTRQNKVEESLTQVFRPGFLKDLKFGLPSRRMGQNSPSSVRQVA